MKKQILLLIIPIITLLLLSTCLINSKNPSKPSDTTATQPSSEQALNIMSGNAVSADAEINANTKVSGSESSASEPNDINTYFDNAVFIGDSIMEGINQYVAKQRRIETTLGEAKFLTTTMGISLADMAGDAQTGVYYSYKGEEKPVEQIVADMGVNRVFLLLGLNDLAASDPVIDRIIEQYGQLIDLLQSTDPNVDIIVITNTPKVASTWLPDYTPNRNFGNKLIDEFVIALKKMCDERGVQYVDANTLLKDENGALPDNYCRDGYLHLNDAGAKVVVDALNDFAKNSK